MFLRKKIEKRWILERFGVYFNITFFVLILFIAYEIMIAARWLIAWGLGAYIFPRQNFEKTEQDARVWVYILICMDSCIKIM